MNHYYLYCVDQNFGPFCLKFCSYFPYNAKLCLNGHEYAKRQLEREGIAYEALDNGIRSCADPKRLQQICDSLSAAKIDALLRKWLGRLPPILTPPPTGLPVIVINSRSGKSSCPSPKCWTVPSVDACSLNR